MLQVFFAFVTHAQDTNINGSFDPMAQLNPPTTVPWVVLTAAVVEGVVNQNLDDLMRFLLVA